MLKNKLKLGENEYRQQARTKQAHKGLKNILNYVRVTDQTSARPPVTIPETLIEKLKLFGFRYIKVEQPIPNDTQSGKRAVEREWQKHPYNADDPQLTQWLNAGGNYGIMAGQGLIVIETDHEAVNEKLNNHQTFTTKSGSKRGHHRFYRSDTSENGVLIDPKTGENLGNIQVQNKYVVGPNCHHYSGGVYTIIDESAIAWIDKKTIEEIFGEAVSWTGQRRKEIEEESANETEETGVEIPLKDLIDTSDMQVLSNGEYQGEHPIHGSENGQNFCVNLKKNVWHCFRCNSGGGGLMWIAVKNGIIKCHEAQKGALKGHKFMQALKAAKDEGFDIKGLYDEDLSPDVERFFDIDGKNKIFRAAYVARELMTEHTYATRKGDKMIFRYEPTKGIYELYGETHIESQTRIKLGKYTSISRQKEVLKFISVSTYKELVDTPTHLIVVRNGVFNLKTHKLEPHNPEYFILNSVNINYDGNADCPKFKQFLSEVIREGDLQTIQEFFGFCVHRQYTFNKAMLLVGEGANGKSTLLETLRAMLGKENVSNEALQTLQNNRFAVSQLYGKLANIYADLPAVALRDTGFFKMLTGNDTISGEQKFKERFNFKNYAKLIFSCNKIPESPDDTDAFYRRWLIITFPNQFVETDDKTDKNLLEKLTSESELGGIFNWALEGLTRLLKNQRFTIGKSIEETRQQYVESSDPIKAFAAEMLEPDPNSTITKDDLYNAYIAWCTEHKAPTTTKNVFAMRLPQHIQVHPSKTTRLGKKVNSWNGVRLKITMGDEQATEVTTISYSKNVGKNIEEYTDEERGRTSVVSGDAESDGQPEPWGGGIGDN